jgi:hypothetical protein
MAKRLPDESSAPAPGESNLRWALRQVEEALRGLQFGAVTLLVQDGVVVQVERTERRRYQRPPPSSKG